MKNTNNELCEAYHLIEIARDLQEMANDATLRCLNYLEDHTKKSLRDYGTDLKYHMTLLEAIEDYINGDEYVFSNYTTLKYDIKDAMDVYDMNKTITKEN